MNLAQRHVVFAAVAAFVAWGLAVRALPVLRFLGYAFTIGCLATFAALILATVTISRSRARYHDSLWLPLAAPAFLDPPKWRSEISILQTSQRYDPIHLYDESFVVSQALDGLLGLALRDFVSSWYGNITKSPVFVNEVDKNIRAALAEIRDRILNEDMVNVVVSKIVPLVTAHLQDFDQAERAVRGRSLNRNVTESEELELAIAAKYKGGKLHPAASLAYSDTKTVQQDHLRKILVRILPDVLSPSMMGSRATLVLVKEIVAGAVLLPVMQLLADPDTWNQLVEAYGRTTLQDRKTVRRMRAALDQHASPLPKAKSDQELPRLAPNDSERAFERFVRVIRKTRNLSDARRFRSSVASQLQRESMVEGQDPVYLRRLEMAKRVLDQKIAKLSQRRLVSPAPPPDSRPHPVANSREWTMVEIMHTASGLSYFMEYMDRQNRMSLVQFWVVVDGFRNPLEDDFGDELNPGIQQNWTDADRMDIAQISETYMLKAELNIPQESKDAIKAFLAAGRKATPQQYRAARTAILSAQSAVLEELESKHLPSFRKSDLYYKFLASGEASQAHPRLQSTGNLVDMMEPSLAPSVKAPHQAASIARTNSQPVARAKDLRRAAVSSSDVRSLASSKLIDDADFAKRSGPSTPLFDDSYDTDPLAHSTHSLGQESLNGDSMEQRQVIENMEAAMNNIMTDSPMDETLSYDDDALFGSPLSASRSTKTIESPRGSLDFQSIDTANKSKPSLATLGLVNTSSRIGVFSDNDLFPDEEKFLEDEYVDYDDNKMNGGEEEEEEDEIHEAAPGDLGLAEAITALNNDIERLVAQESVVDTLTRKAELTNNVAELRILNKSKSSLQREIRRKELQRQQYIVQESDNSLYGRSSISIQSVVVGKEDEGREFALYVIEVQRQAGDQMPAAVWAIPRRYSEFHELHQRLRRRYPSTRSLEFPRRRVVMKLQKQFLQNRRLALEHYLQQLLRMPDVCRSRELRSFLSQQTIISHQGSSKESDAQDIVSRIYNSVTDGMDEFLGNVSVLDQLSVAGQNLISAATNQLGITQGDIVPLDPGPVAEAEAELSAFEDKELEPFVKPICDIFLETFELNRGNNWLRGRAVIVVLHQLLGGTVERKIREVIKGFVQEDSLLKYVDMIRETMWPGGGKLREASPRTPAEKKKSRTEASLMLATLVPDLAANVVGRANAQAAARRVSATMNNARLNQHLVFTILDEVIGVLFDPSKKGFG